ncbi:MAG: ATP-binding protein [Ferruginibacter sp.]|nr:ATP-binding protein [Ferruginibacter sp.]
MEKKVKRIVVVGPESTGKSTLCINLAAHYKSIWVKEYARTYLEKNGTNYTYENLYEIAKGQIYEEEIAHQSVICNPKFESNTPLFIDTNLYVIKVWSEFVFNKCDNRILSEIVKREYDLYLLCNTDLPWVKDNLREYPDLVTREKLFSYYKEELIEQHVPWAIIKGNNKQRLLNAVNIINENMDY